MADHNSAGYPIWCCLRATGSMAGPCTNPNIGVVILGPSPRRFPPPWSVEELDACFVGQLTNYSALRHMQIREVSM